MFAAHPFPPPLCQELEGLNWERLLWLLLLWVLLLAGIPVVACVLSVIMFPLLPAFSLRDRGWGSPIQTKGHEQELISQ
jgi:hypothetical protein